MLIFDPAQVLNVHDEPETYHLKPVGLFIELKLCLLNYNAEQLGYSNMMLFSYQVRWFINYFSKWYVDFDGYNYLGQNILCIKYIYKTATGLLSE